MADCKSIKEIEKKATIQGPTVVMMTIRGTETGPQLSHNAKLAGKLEPNEWKANTGRAKF